MRLIDADEMSKRYTHYGISHPYDAIDLDDMLAEMPTIDAVPVVHGRWTTKRTWEHDGEWYCSVCEYEPVVFMESNYCPNCGAKMD